MRKVLLYMAGAVFLGAIVMLLPLQVLFLARGGQGLLVGHAPYLRTLPQLESEEIWADTYEYDNGAKRIAYPPANSFVWILGVGFFVALGVYSIFKRRRPISQIANHPYSYP